MERTGVVGIAIKTDTQAAIAVQKLLGENADIIVGRMGVPDKESGVNTIALIVKASNERISALAGKLGKISNVNVKSALINID